MVFYYRQEQTLSVTDEAIRMKVLGPWFINIPGGTYSSLNLGACTSVLDSAYISSTGWFGRALYFGSVASAGGAARVLQMNYRNNDNGLDVNSVAPVRQFRTKRYGTPGEETHFSHAVINAQDDDTAYTFGTVTVNQPEAIDFDPLEINTQAHDLQMHYNQGVVTFRAFAEDGSEVTNPSTTQTVNDTTAPVYNATIFHKPTRPVAD